MSEQKTVSDLVKNCSLVGNDTEASMVLKEAEKEHTIGSPIVCFRYEKSGMVTPSATWD